MIYKIPKQPELYESGRLLELILSNSDSVNYKPADTEVYSLERSRLLYITDTSGNHTWDMQNVYIAQDATLVHDDDNFVILPLSVNNSWDTTAGRELMTTVACLNDEADSAAEFLKIFSKSTQDGKVIGDLIASILALKLAPNMNIWAIDLYGMYNAGAIPDDYTHIWRANIIGAHISALTGTMTVDYNTQVATGVGKTSEHSFMIQVWRNADGSWVTPVIFALLDENRGLANLIDYAIPGVYQPAGDDLFDTITFSYRFIWVSTEESAFFQEGYSALQTLVTSMNDDSSSSDRRYLRS